MYARVNYSHGSWDEQSGKNRKQSLKLREEIDLTNCFIIRYERAQK